MVMQVKKITIIPFLIRPNYSNNHSIIEIADGWEIDFTQNKTIRDVLGFGKQK